MWLKNSEFIGHVGADVGEEEPKLKNSLFFSLLAGNLDAETGSIATASATTHSYNLEISRSVEKAAVLAGFRASVLFLETADECVLRTPASSLGPSSLRCSRTALAQRQSEGSA
jgi:hypothetical protein